MEWLLMQHEGETVTVELRGVRYGHHGTLARAGGDLWSLTYTMAGERRTITFLYQEVISVMVSVVVDA